MRGFSRCAVLAGHARLPPTMPISNQLHCQSVLLFMLSGMGCLSLLQHSAAALTGQLVTRYLTEHLGGRDQCHDCKAVTVHICSKWHAQEDRTRD